MSKIIYDKKQLINFLIVRWQSIVGFAALERVYLAACIYAEENNQQKPDKPTFMIPCACRQIEIIKQHIIDIVPTLNFIDYTYEAQAPLNPKDFIELFIEDHNLCIYKILNQLERLKIT